MKKMKILMLEDNRFDADLIKEELISHKFDFTSEVVQTEKDFINAIHDFKPDIILSDYSLPQFTGFEALEIAKKLIPDIPFIIITGSLSEEMAADSIKRGAWDYVLKENLVRLTPAIESAFKLKDEKDKNQLAEKSLKESEYNYRLLFDNMSEGIFVLDAETQKVVLSNNAIAQIYGFDSEADTDDVNPIDFVLPEDKEAVYKIIAEDMFKNDLRQTNEFRSLTKDGREIWISTVGVRTKYKGRLAGLISVIDITERKKAEEKLKHSEYKLSEAERIGNTGSWEYDVASDTASWSENMFQIFDVDPAMPTELIFKHFVENLVHPDDREHILTVFQDALIGKQKYDLEYRINKRDGSIVDIHALAETFRDEQGRATHMIGKVEDITERKRAETELKRQKDLFELVINSVPSSIFWKDLNSVYLGCNTHFAKEAGMKNPEEVIGSDDDVMVWGKDADKYRADDKLVMSTGKSKLDYEEDFLDIEGKKVWWETNKIPLRSSDGKTIGILSTAHNITIKKMAQNALQESEEKYRNLIVTTSEGFWLLDSDQKTIDVNQSLCDMLGYSRSEVIGKTPLDFINDESIKIFKEQISQITNTLHRTYEIKLKKKNGTNFHTIFKATSLIDKKGKPAGSFVLVTDITERKQAEEQIKTKSLFLESLIQQSPLPTFVMDSKGFNVMVNEAFLKFYAVPDKDMILGRNALTEPANVSQGVVKYFKEALKGKIVEMPEIEFVSPYENKKVITRCKVFPILDPKGTLTNVVVMQEDITKRKQAEEALKVKNLVFDVAIAAKSIANRDGIISQANKSFLEIWGYSKMDEVIGKPISHFIQNEDEAIEIITALNTIGKWGGEYTAKRKDGSTFIAQGLATNLLDDKGDLIGYQSSTIDITKHKQAEKTQKALYNISNAVNTVDNMQDLYSKIRDFLGDVIDTTNFYVALYDEKTDMISLAFNYNEKNDYESFPAGKTLTKYVIQTGKSLFAPRQLRDELNKQGKIETIGTRSEIWLGVPLKVDNKVIGVIAVQSYDDPNLYSEKDIDILTFISEEIALAIKHKQADEQIRRELKEKELLLREVHHRVKNNLQVISSLLQLQQNEITTKEDAIKGFASSQDRIMSMAKAYELLLGSEYMSEVSVGKYITSLAEQLKYNYDLEHKVKIKYSFEEITIGIEILDRLGLILNEILTNSIKYAFEGRSSGNIHVELTDKKDNFVLKISDDGIGMPADINIDEPETLGLSIIKMITDQLYGTLSLDRENGTSFTLVMPKELNN